MTKLCSKCGRGLAFDFRGSYCRPCRKVVNAKRNSPEARAARSEKYYWAVHVPKLQQRLNAKYPINGGKLGVYYQKQQHGPDNDEYQFNTFRKLAQEGYENYLAGESSFHAE